MQNRSRQITVLSAILTAALLSGAVARPLDDLPSSNSEWTSALSQYTYVGQPVTQAQDRNSKLAAYLKSLGLVKRWQNTTGNQVQEGWYSALQGVTVVTTATLGDRASLRAQVLDGQVSLQAALAAVTDK